LAENSLTIAGALSVSEGGRLALSGGGTVSATALNLTGGGTLDITQNNTLIINYATSADPASLIRGYLKSAYNGGLWTGPGLTSSTVEAQVAATISARTGGVYGIGYVDGAVDTNQAANAVVNATGSQIVYVPALIGDANLDGSVTFIDLGIVAQNLGATNADWEHGDFNYDGSVNFLDIGLLAQNLNYNTINTPLSELIPGASAALTAQWNLALAELRSNSTQPADLPEPGMVGLLVVGAAGLLARRPR
jgi:MYXO-CTERM domain-containing protein